MFAYLKGTVTSLQEGTLILDVNGIGYTLQVPKTDFFQIKQTVTISVHMHWNSENGPALYGFSSELEKTIFLLVTSCSGLGPKIGLSVLGNLTPAAFLQAIQEGDDKALSAINGIGAKKAEQIIVHLRHKVAKLIDSGIVVEGATQASLEQWRNLTQVLQSLNYSRQEIEAALAHVRKDTEAKAPFDALMRQALSFLAKKM